MESIFPGILLLFFRHLQMQLADYLKDKNEKLDSTSSKYESTDNASKASFCFRVLRQSHIFTKGEAE